MTIFFQGKSPGDAVINFKDETILENSPRGANIFSFSQQGNYTIFEVKPPEVPKKEKVPAVPVTVSPTHPQPDKWYSNNNPEFQWEVPLDIIGLSFAFNQAPTFNPDNISEGIFNTKTFKEVADGVWYFHLKLKNEAGWGHPSHFRVQIDTTPPSQFEVVVDNEGDPTNPNPLLYFEAKDDTSGISYYEIQIGAGDVFKIFEVETNSLRMPPKPPALIKY